MPLITSANIACGAHAGDAATMRTTVRLALRAGIAIGAHPGYRDPANFGRVPVEMPPELLRAELLRQLEELRAIAQEAGARLAHVKAHGALYNQAERDPGIAATIAGAVRSLDEHLVLFASATSAMAGAAERIGLRVAREGFADRAYERDGTLRSRRLPGAVHSDPGVAAAQAVSIARDGAVRAYDGTAIRVEADTLCIHGDTPGAPEIARAVRAALVAAGIPVSAFAA